MRTIQAQTAIEDNFEQEGVLSEDETPEILDIDASESGELQPYSQYPQADKPKISVNDTFFSEWASWRQFFSLLLKTGGWTVAVLLAFRFVLIPLLTAGNTPVALTLAIAVSIFLVLCAVGALVRDFKR
ncbi:MAG: hypothetical protein HC836_41360 [Richelia sp. RM2_1_2]|nr:hypothetical protein [Richelia sp. SM2_1_7]NJM21746.1 hypothetical protein [Richelia sp. SM1_7_0]NJN12874.1 hypothetical protein [Richelia sp. RM1_1_1]NJO31196.1 hypothetical protein [Richelia sp. SL_2_1]NJO64394.1 hypothetical protein [Richelia sp. RM2_1_2]